MTRGQRGSGTIDRHGRRWRVRLSLPDGRRRALYTEPDATYEDAVALRDAALEQLAGTALDPRAQGTTLGAWGETWLEARERTHRDHAGDVQRWRAYIAPAAIAAVHLEVLGPHHVVGFLEELVARPARGGGAIARGTARNVWATLRACLRAAAAKGKIRPARRAELLAVELPSSPVASDIDLDERIEYLRDEEISAVLRLDLTAEQYSAFVVGVWTGCRAGELHGLRWERVRFKDEIPHVVVARSRDSAPKNGVVARVPLLEPARAVLHRRWLDAGRPTTGLVWPAEGGGCHARGYDWGWSDHRQRRAPTRAELEAGAPAGVPVMDVRHGIRTRAGIARVVDWNAATRHTCAVHLLRGTWAPDVVPRRYSLEEVSRFLRHSSVKVTERHYAHLGMDALPVGGELSLGPPGGAYDESGVDAVTEWSGSGPARGNGAGALGAGPELVQPGPATEFLSHTGDLNSGPTVYETVAQARDHTRNAPSGPGRDLREVVAEALGRLEAGDPAGAREVLAAALEGRAPRYVPRAGSLRSLARVG